MGPLLLLVAGAVGVLASAGPEGDTPSGDAAARLEALRRELPGLEAETAAPAPVDFSSLGRPGEAVTLWCPESVLSHRPGQPATGCRKVTFAIGAGSLSAEVPLDGGPGVPKLTRTVDFEQVVAAERVTVTGTHRRTIERDARGGLSERITAMPLLTTLPQVLDAVGRDRVSYGLVAVRPVAVCARREVSACVRDDGSPGECGACVALGVGYESLSPGHAFGRSPTLVVPARADAAGPAPSCRACPSDQALMARASELSGASRDVVLHRRTPPYPVLTRTRAACLQALEGR